MLNNSTHTVHWLFAHLILLGSLFCVLFGQGLHIHSISLHVGDYLDVHAHVHAHESQDEQPDHADNKPDDHQHEVSTSDIFGTLTTSVPVEINIQAQTWIAPQADFYSIVPNADEVPMLFDLPPPRPASNQYHLSSFSHRGPPVA